MNREGGRRSERGGRVREEGGEREMERKGARKPVVRCMHALPEYSLCLWSV